MPKQKSQKEKFEEAARELETDEAEENFDRIVKRLARSKPVPKKSKPNDAD